MTTITFAALYPLSVRLGTDVIHGMRDKHIFLWDLWWVQYAITSLHQSPLTTDYLFAPEGVSLSFHTLTLTNGIMGIILGSRSNLILAHNLLLVVSFILSCYFTYLLVKELTNSRVGALFGAILFTFGPARWFMVFNGQMNLSSTQWIPLFLFFMVRFIRLGSWRYSIYMALSLAALFYTSFQQMIFAFTLVILLLPSVLISLPPISRVNLTRLTKRTILFISLFLVLASPLLIEMWQHNEEAIIDTRDVEWRNMSVSPQRLLYGMRYYNRWDEIELPGSFSKGWTACRSLIPSSGPVIGYISILLILAGWGSLFCWRGGKWHVIYWSLSIFLFAWMMMGPEPYIFGIHVPSLTPLLRVLPGYSAIRGVIRYSIPLTLSAAILSGYIFTRVKKQLNNRKNITYKYYVFRQRLFLSISILFIMSLYIEFYKAPIHARQLSNAPPPYYEGGIVHCKVDDTTSADSLLELPYWYSGGGYSLNHSHYETLYYQTIHHRKMIGGHVSRLSPTMSHDSMYNPVLVYLSNTRLSRVKRPTIEDIRKCLLDFRIRFINVSRQRYHQKDEQILIEILENEVNAEIVHMSNAFLTYDCGE